MPISVMHVKSVTVSDDTNSSIVRPSDWNSAHSVSVALSSTEIIRAIQAGGSSVSVGNVSFVNSNNLSWGMDSAGKVTGSYSQTAAAAVTQTLSVPMAVSGLAEGMYAGGIGTLGRIPGGTLLAPWFLLIPFYLSAPISGSVGVLLQLQPKLINTGVSTAVFSGGLFSLNGGTISTLLSSTAGLTLSMSGAGANYSMTAGGASISGATVTYVEALALVVAPGTFTLAA